MLKRMIIALSLYALFPVTGAAAQQSELPQQDLGTIAPPAPKEERALPRMPGAGLSPYKAPAPYEPGFVAPLTKETATGRMGVAGWTSPNPRVGAHSVSDSHSTGWLGVGFGIVWGDQPGRTMTR